ncbi:MAG: formylglycine-generating enzyme family protein, partial [Rhizobiaceae bacterium]
FIRETGHQPPRVDPRTWESYRLIHPYERTSKFQWKGGKPREGRLNHPVTMIAYGDALAYAKWLSDKTGNNWRLPTQLEWEKAVRGSDGRIFPWGNEWNPDFLNSHDKGPFDTVPAGKFPDGASPYGLLDGAGQVFEWVAEADGKERHFVKGGSWDDKGCGVCRPAARHSRPDEIRHILIGFRLVHDLE